MNSKLTSWPKINPNLKLNFSASLFSLDRSESLSGALDGCYSYDGEMNKWNLFATLKKPRYRFSHVMINKDTMWLTGKYIF